MRSMIPAATHRLLSEYSLEISTDILQDDVTCILCTKLINEAYLAYCGCQYCHRCIVEYSAVEGHYCPGGKTECTEESLEVDVNVFRNPMLDRKLLRTKVICPNEWCTHSTELSQITDHLGMCTRPSINCPYLHIGCDSAMSVNEDIVTHLNDNALSHTKLLSDSIQNLMNEVNALKEDSRIKQNILDEQSRQIQEQNVRIYEQSRQIEEQNTIIEEISQTNNQSMIDTRGRLHSIDDSMCGINAFIGNVTFEVTDFYARMNSDYIVFSPYFYSHTNGYKLRLKVDLLSDYLSVYIQIMNGEFDDLLSWPCRLEFEISIFNPEMEQSIFPFRRCYDYVQDIHKHKFNKPNEGPNNPFGCDYYLSFVYILRLYSGHLFNNSLIIKCNVRQSS